MYQIYSSFEYPSTIVRVFSKKHEGNTKDDCTIRQKKEAIHWMDASLTFSKL